MRRYTEREASGIYHASMEKVQTETACKILVRIQLAVLPFPRLRRTLVQSSSVSKICYAYFAKERERHDDNENNNMKACIFFSYILLKILLILLLLLIIDHTHNYLVYNSTNLFPEPGVSVRRFEILFLFSILVFLHL